MMLKFFYTVIFFCESVFFCLQARKKIKWAINSVCYIHVTAGIIFLRLPKKKELDLQAGRGVDPQMEV